MILPVLENAVLYVDQSLLQSPNPQPPVVEKKFIGFGTEFSPYVIHRDLQRLISEHNEEKSRIDGNVAEMLHRHLVLTRREASEMRFWHYLAIVECPFYVAWRYFDEREGKVNRERYLGTLDRNALSRLWWWAELTVTDNRKNYERTLRAAESGEFVKGAVENLHGGNADVLHALIDVLFTNRSRPSDALVNGMSTKINALLVTVAVDALAKEEIARLVVEVYKNETRTKLN